MSENWWFEYRQERRINRLRDDLDLASLQAAADASDLRSRLSQVQGSLEARLNRLATSFDAFVELSGLREQLAMYDLEAAARNRAHRLVVGLARRAAAPASMSPPPPLDLEDCPGYWLPPAAEGLAALVRGDEVEAERYVAEARTRDCVRTARFLTLGLTVAGETALACHWLDDALPPLGRTVSSDVRTIWEMCATGGLGDTGRRHVEARLTEWVAGLSADEARVAKNKWRQRAMDLVESVPQPSLPTVFRHLTESAESIRAADQLDRLLCHVEKALGNEVPTSNEKAPGDEAPTSIAKAPGDEAATNAERAPGVEGPVGVGTRPGFAGGEGAQETGGVATAFDDGRAGQMRDAETSARVGGAGQAQGAGGNDKAKGPVPGLKALIDEGSVEEVQLLTRIRELRNVIETGVERKSTPADPDTVSVLCADAFGADPDRGRPALLATAAWLAELAEVRAETARKPVPDSVSIDLWRERVTLQVGREPDLSAVDAAIEKAAEDDLGKGIGRMARQLTSRKRQEEWMDAEKATAARKASEALRQWTEHMSRCADAADRGTAASRRITTLLGQRVPRTEA